MQMLPKFPFHKRTPQHRVFTSDPNELEGSTCTIEPARRGSRAALIIRGVVFAKAYMHHTGRIYDIDVRENMDNLCQMVVEPLVAKYGRPNLDIFLATYEPTCDESTAVIADVKMILESASSTCSTISPPRFHPHMPIDMQSYSQRRLTRDAVKHVLQIGTKYDDMIVVRFDTLWKVPVTSVFPAPVHWHPQIPYLSTSGQCDNPVTFLFYETPPARSPHTKELISDVFFAIPLERQAAFLDALDANIQDNNLHTIFLNLSPNRFVRESIARSYLPANTTFDSNTDNQANPIYNIVRMKPQGWWKMPLNDAAKPLVSRVFI